MQCLPSQLPKPQREFIGQLSRQPGVQEDAWVEPMEHCGAKYFRIVLGLLMAAPVAGVALFWRELEYSRLLDLETVLVGGGVLLLAALLLVFAWARLRILRQSQIRPSLIATPIGFGRFGADHEPARLHYLRDLTGLDATHRHTNGSYMHTSFLLKFGNEALQFMVMNKARAEGLVQLMQGARARLERWQQQGSLQQRLAVLDWIGTMQPVPVEPESRPWWTSGSRKLQAAALLAALGTVGLWSANRTIVDRTDWARAEQSNSARGFRRYLSLHGEGRFVASAHERLQSLYRDAMSTYRGKAEQAIPEALEGMQKLLAHLAGQSEPKVGICFLAGEGLDGMAIDRAVGERTGSSRVQPVGPSFTAAKNQLRESRIVECMQASFGSVFSGDLFELKPVALDQPGPRFLVRYRVAGSDSIYTNRAEDGKPMAGREVFAGIQLSFDFALQVPGTERPPEQDATKGWCFRLDQVKPAPNFTVHGRSSFGVGADSVYDTMVGTAFERFTIELANAYGLERKMPVSLGGPDAVPASMGR